MAAPSTAYAIKDGNFVKAVIRNGSTPYYVYVAKFLSGAQSDGGYSTASTTMRSNIKSLFRLDELVDVREKQEDGSVKVIGFVGCVKHGSANADFHASKRVSGARVRDDDGDEYDVLNDAGLNRLPQVVFQASAQWANWISWKVVYWGGMYGKVDEGQFTASYFNISNALEPAITGEEKTLAFSFTDPSDDPALTGDGMLKYNQGYNVACSAWAENSEGRTTADYSFVAKARVMYPRGIARKYSGKPSRIDDEYTSVDFDMYEDGYLQAKAITSTGNISGPYVYAAPRGSTPPALTTPLDAAWYYLGFGGGGTKLLAFQVDSTGKIVASTEIQPAALPQYALTISIQIGTDRTDTDCYAIEYSIVATPDAIDLCNKIRVTINTPETNNSLNYGFQAYNPDNTMYAPRASSGSARSIVMSTDADTTVVVRGIRRSSAAGGTWLDLLQGNPDGYVTDVNELRTAIVEAYCTIEDMGNGSSWGQISPSVEIVFAKNYVNTGMRI